MKGSDFKMLEESALKFLGKNTITGIAAGGTYGALSDDTSILKGAFYGGLLGRYGAPAVESSGQAIGKMLDGAPIGQTMRGLGKEIYGQRGATFSAIKNDISRAKTRAYKAYQKKRVMSYLAERERRPGSNQAMRLGRVASQNLLMGLKSDPSYIKSKLPMIPTFRRGYTKAVNAIRGTKAFNSISGRLGRMRLATSPVPTPGRGASFL